MIRLPPRATRTDTLFPYTSLVRSVLIVGVIFLRTADDLAVQRVLHLPFDLHPDGLVAPVGHHRARQYALRHRSSPYFPAAPERPPRSVSLRAIERRPPLPRAPFSSPPLAPSTPSLTPPPPTPPT